MSSNSFFRDITGERDPIMTESRTTVVVGAAGASGSRFREWQVACPDKASVTRIDILWGTAGSGASGDRQLKLKLYSVPATGSAVPKGLAVGTIGDGETRNLLSVFPSSAATFPADCVIGIANAGGFPTGGLGVKLGVYVTKGHVQA